MVKEAILKALVFNGNVYSIEDIESAGTIEGPSIYEVVRIIEGVPLYLEEHLERLRRSGEILKVDIKNTDEEIVSGIYKIIEENNERNLNAKILCGNFNKAKEDMWIYFIDSFYPTKDMYIEGVDTILFKGERENPNAKVSDRGLRDKINREREEKNAFEALLVNNKGNITEGSRSNVFFVKGQIIYTPPAMEVLLGVTRTKILELCRKNGIEVVEDEISINNLDVYDGVFITGTSIDVLPVKTIEGMTFESSKKPIIKRLMDIYREDVLNYIKGKRGTLIKQ